MRPGVTGYGLYCPYQRGGAPNGDPSNIVHMGCVHRPKGTGRHQLSFSTLVPSEVGLVSQCNFRVVVLCNASQRHL